MTKSQSTVECATLAQQHCLLQDGKQQLKQTDTNNYLPQEQDDQTPSALSTIAILRRHTMYDSLVLVKRFNPLLGTYNLEFPTTFQNAQSSQQHQKQNNLCSNNIGQDCCATKLVSVYLDDDDPMYLCNSNSTKNKSDILKFCEDEIVYVPMNGLMSRLENYDKVGITIDSRVYAFAIGLKTADQFMTSSSMKELHESPPQ